MNTTEIIAAINDGHPIRIEHVRNWGQFPKLCLFVDEVKIGQVSCPNGALPTVTADTDIVRVRAGNGTRRGFSIKCASKEDARYLTGVLTVAVRSFFEQQPTAPLTR